MPPQETNLNHFVKADFYRKKRWITIKFNKSIFNKINLHWDQSFVSWKTAFDYHTRNNKRCLPNSASFVQFKKRKKPPWRSVTFSIGAGLKAATLLKVCFLNWYKWCHIGQRIKFVKLSLSPTLNISTRISTWEEMRIWQGLNTFVSFLVPVSLNGASFTSLTSGEILETAWLAGGGGAGVGERTAIGDFGNGGTISRKMT